MKFPYVEKKEVLNTEQAWGCLLAETDNNDIVELHIQKRGLVSSHALPIDVTFYVVSGKGTITVSNKIINALKGDVIEVKRDLDRIWENPFSEPLVLLAIKQKS